MKVKIFQGHRPALPNADVHVVIDVIRAFTTAFIAFERGAHAILLVSTIDEAFTLRESFPDYLLAGERNALQIEGFDLGNSPWQMSQTDVAGRGIIFTTTNGVTATLHALSQGGKVLVTGYLGAAQTVAAIKSMAQPNLRINLIASHPTGDEDLAAAEWIERALLSLEPMNHNAILHRIKTCEAAGKFYDPQRQKYDPRDMDMVLQTSKFPLAMAAIERDGVPMIVPLKFKEGPPAGRAKTPPNSTRR